MESEDPSFGHVDRLMRRVRGVQEAYQAAKQNDSEEVAEALLNEAREVWGMIIASHGSSEQISAEFSKIPGAQAPGGRVWDMDVAIHNWLACVDAFRDPAKRVILKTAFSPTQLKSLALLLEWWDSPSGGTDDIRPWIRGSDHRSPPHIVKGRTLAHTHYQTALAALWFLEFTMETKENSDATIIEESSKQRQRAAEAAAAHRTALESLGHIQPWGQHSDEPPVPAFFTSCRWLNIMHRRRKGYPHFLWDIELRRTVETPRGGVDYLVISHTWGRWVIPDTRRQVPGVRWPVPCNSIFDVGKLPDIFSRLPFNTRYVWFDLVCIPQDATDPLMKVEIARQAAIFTNSRWATIWCNRVDDWSGLEAAVRWLSSVYISHSISLGPELKNSSPNLEDIAKCASKTTQLVNVVDSTRGRARDGLAMPHVQDEKILGWFEPDGWFSSLWTLQEACLRPDLYLCDRNWRVARPSGDQHSIGIQGAITFDCLVALFNAVLLDLQKYENYPLAVVELIGILQVTGMHKLLGLGPIDVLLLGNQRYCEDANRAVAIMSVLGATDWYDSRVARIEDVKGNDMDSLQFVYRRYPVEFLNEVRAHFGGLFFYISETIVPRKNRYSFSWWPWKRRITGTKQKATMLPLTEDMQFGHMRIVPTDTIHNLDHPTVQTWSINVDGSVSILKAGVVAASSSCGRQRDPDAVLPRAIVSASIPGRKQPFPSNHTVSLTEWLDSFRPSADKYAIVLFRKMLFFRRTWSYKGVLLERVYRQNTRDFINIGLFDIPQIEGDDSDWPDYILQEQLDIRVI